jgi:glycosyl hydrolase family 123
MKIVTRIVIAAALLCAASAGAAEPVVIVDFEHPLDRRLVDTRHRAMVSDDVSSRGRNSLQLRTGEYINIRTSRLGRARAGDRLRIDFFNATRSTQRVRAEIFDADARKSYWHRYVREYTLRPGWNTLSFGVARLQRGEKNSQRIKNSFLVPGKINRVDLDFGAGRDKGFIYLDNVRFEPDRPMPKVPGLRAFDFGPQNQAQRVGFTPSSRERYSKKRGHGWSSTGWPGAVRDYTHPNDLLADFREARGETFSVDVPNGPYRVRVYFEDHGWWESQFARFGRRTVTAEKKQVHNQMLDRAAAAKRFYRFADVEPAPDTDVFDTYIRNGNYKPVEFEIAVSDKRLDVRFDADRPMCCRVAALVLWPTNEADAAAEWCAELDRRLENEFKAENVYVSSAPKRTADALAGGLAVFSAGIEPTGPDYVPLPGELVKSLALFAAPGQAVGTSLSVRALKTGGPLEATVTLDGASPALFRVQNRLKRHGGEYTIVPDILRAAAREHLPARRTRQFWLDLSVPADAKPGVYRGEVRVSLGKQVQVLPLTVDVLPVKLAEPTFAFGLFGLLPDSYAPPDALTTVVRMLKSHGLNAACGVPLGKVIVKDGALALETTQSDELLAVLKREGLARGIDTYGGPRLAGIGQAAKEARITPQDAVKRSFALLERHAKLMKWPRFSYSMVDEPHWSDKAVADATKSVTSVKGAAPWMLVNGYWSPKASDAAHRKLMDALDRTMMGRIRRDAVAYLKSKGKGVGYYGGCSRHEFGLRQWAAAKEGLEAHYAWHFYIRYGDLYYDLDAREPDVCMVYYTPTEVRPSLRLKQVRAGAYDFRYLWTLAEAVKTAKPSASVGRAKALLRQAAAAGNLYREKNAPKIGDVDAFRRKVAEAIVELQKQAK